MELTQCTEQHCERPRLSGHGSTWEASLPLPVWEDCLSSMGLSVPLCKTGEDGGVADLKISPVFEVWPAFFTGSGWLPFFLGIEYCCKKLEGAE